MAMLPEALHLLASGVELGADTDYFYGTEYLGTEPPIQEDAAITKPRNS